LSLFITITVVWYEDSLVDYQLPAGVGSVPCTSTINLLIFCHKLGNGCYGIGQPFGFFSSFIAVYLTFTDHRVPWHSAVWNLVLQGQWAPCWNYCRVMCCVSLFRHLKPCISLRTDWS